MMAEKEQWRNKKCMNESNKNSEIKDILPTLKSLVHCINFEMQKNELMKLKMD